MQIHRLLPLLLTLPILPSTALGDGGFEAWEPLHMPSEFFDAAFPGAPEHSTKARPTPAGRVASDYWVAVSDGVSYRVEVHRMPKVASWLMSTKRMLARSQEDLVKDDAGTHVRSRDVKTAGFPSREVTYRAGDGRIGHARIVVAHNRIYMIQTMRLIEAATDPVARFFDAFELQRVSAASVP